MNFRQSIKKNPVAPWIIEVRSFLRNPSGQIQVWLDVLKTRKDVAFLRKLPPVSLNGKKAIIIPLGIIQSTKIESMLAVGLRLRGWSVKALMHGQGSWIQKRYFSVFGINNYSIGKHYSASKKEIEDCKRSAQEFLEKPLTFRLVKDWTYRNVVIGPTLLSNIQRTNRLGAPDLANPNVTAQLKMKLPQILEWVHICEKVLATESPDLIYLIETNDWNRPLVDLAVRNGIDVIQVTQPFRDDALVLKRLNSETFGTHPNSITRATLRKFINVTFKREQDQELKQEFQDRYGGRWFLQNRNQPDTEKKTKVQIKEQLKLDPDKKTAVVFSHILWDANLFYGEDLFNDYSDWFRQTVRATCENDRLNWIIKLHPGNLWKRALENETGELAEMTVLKQNELWPLPKHVHLLYPDTDINTLSLYESIDYGITVRGTPGLELPCFGVATLTAGTGRYSGCGFTVDSKTPEEYLHKLANLESLPMMDDEQVHLAKWHAYLIFRLRPWDFSSFCSKFGKLKNMHPLAYNAEITARSIDEIRSNRDLDRWADWVEHPEQPADYLDQEKLKRLGSVRIN
jgi:hypothetical protein